MWTRSSFPWCAQPKGQSVPGHRGLRSQHRWGAAEAQCGETCQKSSRQFWHWAKLHRKCVNSKVKERNKRNASKEDRKEGMEQREKESWGFAIFPLCCQAFSLLEPTGNGRGPGTDWHLPLITPHNLKSPSCKHFSFFSLLPSSFSLFWKVSCVYSPLVSLHICSYPVFPSDSISKLVALFKLVWA